MENKNDRQIVVEAHKEFDWDNKVCGKTLKDAGQYLIDLAKKLPENARIQEYYPRGSYETEIRVISERYENDEEYGIRKNLEEIERERREKRDKQEEQRKKDEAEFKRLKDKLGYR